MESLSMTDNSRELNHSFFRRLMLEHAGVVSIAAFFLLCVVVFSLSTDHFMTSGNLLNVLRQNAPLLIVASIMTLVITTGGIDLSVGSTLALTGALSAVALSHWEVHWAVVVVAALALGALIGAINGYFIAYEGIPAFIVTLASLTIIRGIGLLITQGYSIPIPDDSPFAHIGRAWLFDVPLPGIIAFAVVGCAYLTLNNMRYGRYVTGIGSNAEGVRRAGVNTKSIISSVYVLSGMAAALAGVIITARLGSGSSNQGVGFELEVIAVVVIGSTNLFGGRGTIVGTVLGALTVGVINNGLILAHVSPFYTQIVTGVIILIAIWLNTRIFNPSSSSKG